MIRAAVLLLGLMLAHYGWGETINIAVASNFKPTAQKIVTIFQNSSKHTARISAASTGILYSQIKHGAQFDLLLAADKERPALLEKEGLTLANSRFTYAEGHIVLVSSTEPAISEMSTADIKLWLSNYDNKLAIANPDVAPYGLAAKQFLVQLDLWDTLQTHLIRGSNINQAYQYIATGSVKLAIVAATQLIIRPLTDQHSWTIPNALYQPIIQQAVQLRRSKDNKAAEDFLLFLKSPEAQDIIRSDGYSTPSKPTVPDTRT